jgi:hypothetical protein
MAFKLFSKNKSDKSSKDDAAKNTTPAVLVTVESTKENVDEVAPNVVEEIVQPAVSEDYRSGENKYEDDDLSQNASQCSAKSEWDEGGASQCGYSQIVHDTLMSVGQSVHSIIGDPPAAIEKEMKSVGGWFQEASYAVRDYTRGNANIEQETQEVVSTIISGGSTLGSPVNATADQAA